MPDAKTTERRRFGSVWWRALVLVFGVLVLLAMLLSYSTVAQPPTAETVDPFAAAARTQLLRLLAAGFAGAVVIVVFIALGLVMRGVGRVTRVAEALAEGHSSERTGMSGADELGRLGAALDRYADSVDARVDHLHESLRRQRRETEHLNSVLGALPHGVIVQDIDGRVVLLNDHARMLLGAQTRGGREANLNDITALVTDALGLALAPGLYAVGNPKYLELDGRMVSAHAVALTSLANKRVGTVIVLHDTTDDVRRERARDQLVDRLEADVQSSLAAQGRLHAGSRSPDNFAREINRHANALQKFIIEMRELTADFKLHRFEHEQRPLLLDTLIWALANEWRQVAQTENLTLQVKIGQRGLYVLGDERRLRWALGNIVDNAIKYTPPGGTVVLEVRGELDGKAHLRLHDNGVGIAKDELPHVFTRFYRGNPATEGGRALRVPGSGQGLSIARHIIEMHGGSIRLKSSQWVGTAVYVALPLTAPVSLELPRLFTTNDMDGDTVDLDEMRRAAPETVRVEPITPDNPRRR